MPVDERQDLLLVLRVGAVGELALPPARVLFPRGSLTATSSQARVACSHSEEAAVYVSVLIRRLKPGKTYDDFVRAWYPDKGFGIGGRGPILARNVDDEREILASR